jgi:cysteine synthase A
MLEQKGILSCIGQTPLIHLEKLYPNHPIRLYGKMEAFNPGGSIKDRPAIRMIQAALEQGIIDQNTTIIESSSGNLGIGLSQACAYWGLRFICVTDRRCTAINKQIMEAYGTQIEYITEPDPETGDLLAARLKRVQHLLKTIPNSFNPNQYKNRENPKAHYLTAEEILSELDHKVDYIFCATSTCGTLRGCSEYIAKKGLPTKVFAVDAIGSVIFGDSPKKRLLPGHGAGVVPPHFAKNLAQDHVLVSDLDCIVACRKMIRREGIFIGGSSGAILAGINKVIDRLPNNASCVAILCDSGVRYLDSIYNDQWVSSHFGNVSHLWETGARRVSAM